MRFMALLLIPALALAAPVPKSEKPAYELKLSAKNPDVLNIMIQNNGKEPLKLPYRVTPLEHFTIELRGEAGKQYTISRSAEGEDEGKIVTLTIEPGESKSFSIHTCHYLPELGEQGQKVTFKASWKLERHTIESELLTVDP